MRLGPAAAIAFVLAVVGAGTYAAVVWGPFAWQPLMGLRDAPAIAAPAPPARDVVPPVPRRGETALARARTLAAGGHLRDALSALDLVRPTDAQKANADRLRADIQRQLLGLTSIGPPASTPREASDGRVP